MQIATWSIRDALLSRQPVANRVSVANDGMCVAGGGAIKRTPPISEEPGKPGTMRRRTRLTGYKGFILAHHPE